MTILKNSDEIENLKAGGRILAGVLAELKKSVRPGVKAKTLDALAEKLIIKAKATPAFKGYQGFPASLCVSVNSEVVHGLPDNKVFKSGDLVGLDCGVKYRGLFTDAAITMGVGQLSPKAKKLTSVAREAFFQAAKIIKPGVTTGDIGNAIQVFVEANGYNVVRALVGHGVGRQVHEEPKLPNYGTPGTGMKLPVGVVLAIEPMVVEGHYQVVTAKDNWTVITADSGLAAHYEHTVLVTENGCEIITKL